MAHISVITVVRNGAAFLEATIESVLEQKKRVDLDYLIIDGASTDGSVEIIRRYADRLAYWVSEADAGIYDAMNKGWAAARPDSFILFLGAGDLIVSLPLDPSVYGGVDVVYGSVLLGERGLFRPRLGFHLKLYNSLHHQALLVRKACHPQAPFDTSFRLYADFDFNQRLLKSGARFVQAPGFISLALPGGVSDQQDFHESLRVIRQNFGMLWLLTAAVGFVAIRLLPFLKVLRPFRKLPAREII